MSSLNVTCKCPDSRVKFKCYKYDKTHVAEQTLVSWPHVGATRAGMIQIHFMSVYIETLFYAKQFLFDANLQVAPAAGQFGRGTGFPMTDDHFIFGLGCSLQWLGQRAVRIRLTQRPKSERS